MLVRLLEILVLVRMLGMLVAALRALRLFPNSCCVKLVWQHTSDGLGRCVLSIPMRPVCVWCSMRARRRARIMYSSKRQY
jgi:hypothetical protein